jgi:hypothetical protein
MIGLTGESLGCVGMIGVRGKTMAIEECSLEARGKRLASEEKSKDGLNAETQRAQRFAKEERASEKLGLWGEIEARRMG